jgi:hypothetical protein
MKPTIYQTDEEVFKCMDLDGEGAVIYGTPAMESPQHLMMSSSTSRAAKRRVKPGVAVCARGARVFEGELRSHLPVTASAATRSSAPPTPPMPARHI